MNSDESDPKDWEKPEEENAPENLRRKWVVEDHSAKKTIPCPSCEKLVLLDSLTCVFCGAPVCESGLLGRIVNWLKRLFR